MIAITLACASRGRHAIIAMGDEQMERNQRRQKDARDKDWLGHADRCRQRYREDSNEHTEQHRAPVVTPRIRPQQRYQGDRRSCDGSCAIRQRF